MVAHFSSSEGVKARLKYVIDGMGMEKFLVLVEEKLGRALTRVKSEALAPRPLFDRMAHIGVHQQKQAVLNWIGVSLPLGAFITDVAVEIVRKNPDQIGFAVQPRRWVVERFFAWIGRNRRAPHVNAKS